MAAIHSYKRCRLCTASHYIKGFIQLTISVASSLWSCSHREWLSKSARAKHKASHSTFKICPTFQDVRCQIWPEAVD